ncbi:MAG: putative Fe-S cluster assembly protein SufT [Oceanococcus sp.]
MLNADTEIVNLNREVIGILVPEGQKVRLPSGTQCGITQALGGSFTIYIEGRLFRINGEDADALGKPQPAKINLPENAGDDDVVDIVWQQLRTCYDPEIPIDIVELGLVYECEVAPVAQNSRKAIVRMTLTAPGCGMGDVLVADVEHKLNQIPTIDETDVELVFDPPWNQSMMSEAARLQTGMYY